MVPPAERTELAASTRLPLVLAAALLALAVAFWWPGGLGFRSDDFLALHHVQDWGRVAADFTGPQYGLERLALFHRPLVTLSIAVDARLGGGSALWPLCANLLVHLANAGLVYLLLRRLTGTWTALCATGFWLLHPRHLEAVSWMVGRVDTHATLFFLLAVELDLRRREGRLRSLLPALTAFVLGCWTKELCLTLPGVLALLWVLREPGRLGQRILVALERLRPYAATLGLVLLLRYVFLGEVVGGYSAQSLDLLPALRFWAALLPLDAAVPSLVLAALALAAALVLARRRLAPVAALLVVAVLLALPAAGAGGTLEPRYGYLPSVALVAALALAGPWPALLLCAAWAGPGLTARSELRSCAAEVVRLEAAARTEIAAATEDPVLVEAPDRIGGYRAFAVGADRLGATPFGDGSRRVLPRRPFFATVPAQRPPPVPGTARPVYEGPELLDREALEQMRAAWQFGDSFARLRLEGLRPAAYDVCVVAMQGWFHVRVKAGPDGSIELGTALAAPLTGLPLHEGEPDRPLVFELWPAIDAGLQPEPALYLEALDADGRRIDAGDRPLWIPLTRAFAAWGRPLRPGLAWLLVPLAFSLPLRLRRRSRRRGPNDREPGSQAGANPDQR